MSDNVKDFLFAVVVLVAVMGGLFALERGVENERDAFRRECRARGGVAVFEREYRCMNPEMFK